jgi:hypothetical protein
MEVGRSFGHLPGEAAENHEKPSQDIRPPSRCLNPGPPQGDVNVQDPQVLHAKEVCTCVE